MYINEAFKTKKPRDSAHLLESKQTDKVTLESGEKKHPKLSPPNKRSSTEVSQEKIQKFLKELPKDETKMQGNNCLTVMNKKEDFKQSDNLVQIVDYTNNQSREEEQSTVSHTTMEKLPNNTLATTQTKCSDNSSFSLKDNNNVIKYDKSVLPDYFSFLLDVLQGLESAWVLLRSRRQLVLFSRVQPIVQKTLRRRLTYEHICQIANLCPELLKLSKWKESTDDVELILCDVSQQILQDKTTNSKTGIVARRIFLHRKLLEYVEQGKLQLDTSDPCKKPSQDDANVAKSSIKRSFETLEEKDESSCEKTLKPDDISSDKPIESSWKDSSISERLLKKVREREIREKNQIPLRDKQREQIILSRLPKLADSIRSIFISSKKTILPLELLLKQLKDQERILFSNEELSEQIHEIEKKIPEWLKVEEKRNIKLVKLNSQMNYFSLRKQLTATSSISAN